MKRRLFEIYIRERNYVTKGYSEISMLKGLAEFFMIAAIFWKFMFPEITIHWIIYFFTACILIVLLRNVGHWWDKNNAYDLEHEFGNKRNPFVKEMRRMLKEKS